MTEAEGELDFESCNSVLDGTTSMETAQIYNDRYGDSDQVEVGCEFEVDGFDVRLPEGKLNINHSILRVTAIEGDTVHFRVNLDYMTRDEYIAEFSEEALQKYQEGA